MDRLYGWKTCENAPIMKAMKQQTNDVRNEFNMRLNEVSYSYIVSYLWLEVAIRFRFFGSVQFGYRLTIYFGERCQNHAKINSVRFDSVTLF